MRKADIGRTLGVLYPEMVVLVVSIDGKGRPNAMPAGWYTRVSFKPPMVAVSIAVANYSNALMKKSRDFVVAVPSPRQKGLIMPLGSTSGRTTDKFRKFRIRTEKACSVKTPLLADAEVNFECRKVSSHRAGDHTIFVGRIVAAHRGGFGRIVVNMGPKGFKASRIARS